MAWINLGKKNAPGAGKPAVGAGAETVADAAAPPVEPEQFELQLESCRSMIAFCR